MNDFNITLRDLSKTVFIESNSTYMNEIGLRAFGKVIPPEEKEQIQLDRNHMLIGFRTPQFTIDNAITIDLNFEKSYGNTVELQSKVITIMGQKGDGKSGVSSLFIDYFIQQRHMKIIIIDPQHEYYRKEKKVFDDITNDDEYLAEIDDFLSTYNQVRRGYKLYKIAPKFLGTERENIDLYYTLSWNDFKDMFTSNNLSAINTLIELLGIENNESNVDFLLSTISENEREIFSWETLLAKLNAYRRTNKKVKRIFHALKTRMSGSQSMLSDNDEDHLNIFKILDKYDGIIFAAELPDTESVDEEETMLTKVYNDFVKIFVMQIRNELRKTVRGSVNSRFKDKQGIVFIIDEADVLIPNGKSSLKTILVRLATKERKTMITLILMTQSADKLDATIFKQSNYIITSAPDKDNAKALYLINVQKSVVIAMQSLRKRDDSNETSIRTSVAQFSLINHDKNNAHIEFYPTLPCADFKKTTINVNYLEQLDSNK